MGEEKQPDESRRKMGILLIIIIGYVLGLFLKRVQLGLVIGIVLGLLAAGLRKR
jgi:F0F1-type ATP synthase assembly protein I